MIINITGIIFIGVSTLFIADFIREKVQKKEKIIFLKE